MKNNVLHSTNNKTYSVKINMDHLEELAKVGIINIAAFTLSFSDLEAALRFGGLFVAFIYTCLKIIQLLKHWK